MDYRLRILRAFAAWPRNAASWQSAMIHPRSVTAVLLLICGMVIVIGGILWLRMHAFLALILGACCVVLLTPSELLHQYANERAANGEMSAKNAEKFPAKPAAARVAEEFGKTCASLGILIAMAAILGEAMLLSGASESIATALLRWLGAGRAH